ncbi:hypothetical protein J1605_016176 [Eschrichtius robustus]|uniref:Uncharacterized protein n=1 Tax=Eschrichtius robustus TaxID=9764 RepID=A0AB34G993_ESCRO|nr:hypothetical protein J1605_016176 [Eschrichtius robustus]
MTPPQPGSAHPGHTLPSEHARSTNAHGPRPQRALEPICSRCAADWRPAAETPDPDWAGLLLWTGLQGRSPEVQSRRSGLGWGCRGRWGGEAGMAALRKRGRRGSGVCGDRELWGTGTLGPRGCGDPGL